MFCSFTRNVVIRSTHLSTFTNAIVVVTGFHKILHEAIILTLDAIVEIIALGLVDQCSHGDNKKESDSCEILHDYFCRK
jgi:hypothetical protein